MQAARRSGGDRWQAEASRWTSCPASASGQLECSQAHRGRCTAAGASRAGSPLCSPLPRSPAACLQHSGGARRAAFSARSEAGGQHKATPLPTSYISRPQPPTSGGIGLVAGEDAAAALRDVLGGCLQAGRDGVRHGFA